MERTMYVIRRSDGLFYWKGNVSSLYDYKGFENAFLFSTKKGANSRIYTAGKGYSAEVLTVKVTLVENGQK